MHDAYRTPLLAVLVVSALFYLGGCSPQETAAQHVAKANEYLEKGELRSADIQLANALQLEPSHAEARWLRAQVALKLGDGVRAEHDTRRAMELGVSQGEAGPTLIRAILLQGHLDRAIAEATSLPTNPSKLDQAILLGLIGKAHVLKGQLAEAQSVVDQALALDASASEALVVKAVIHTLRGQFDDARESVTRALEIDATSADAWSTLGELEAALGNEAEAEAAFGKAIERRQYPSLDRARLAMVRIQLDKIEQAEADVRTLGSQGLKDHPYVNYVTGLLHFNQDRYGEAATAFESAYIAQPGFLPNRMYLAITRYLLGQFERAQLHAQWVQANAPRSQTAGQLLGMVNVNLSDYAAAKHALRTALQNAPDNTTTLRLLATVALLQGDKQQGLDYANRLAVLEPESQQAQELLMVARLMAGEALEEGGSESTAGTDEFSAAFLSALEAFRDNRFEEARARAEQLHVLHPDRVDPINLMAAAYLASGRWDLAKAELEKVLKLKPDDVAAKRNLAKVELQAGELERARTLLQSLVKQQPDDEETALLLAGAEKRLGDTAAGIDVLERVVELNASALAARARLAAEHLDAGNPLRVVEVTQGLSSPQLQAQPALLEMRGKAQTLMGDIGAARSTYEQWARLAPASAPARFFLSDSLAMAGDAGRARAELERALQLDAQYLPARVGEIKMLVQFGELQQAGKALDKLRQDFGERNEVLGIEGWFALGTGDFPTAERRFATMLAQEPNVEIMTLQSRALWSQGKHDEALTLMQDWLKSSPDDTAVLLQVGEAYAALGRGADARSSYEAVIKRHPDHVPALNNLAWLNRERDPVQAMELARRAHRLSPENPQVLDTLGMLLAQRGDVTGAYRFVREAAERAPADPQIQLHLGDILVQQKRSEDARKVLEELVRQEPDSETGKAAKTLLETVRGTP